MPAREYSRSLALRSKMALARRAAERRSRSTWAGAARHPGPPSSTPGTVGTALSHFALALVSLISWPMAHITPSLLRWAQPCSSLLFVLVILLAASDARRKGKADGLDVLGRR